tara:strand:- start:669 stop:911 length:243 start_codon:yes stop_codon:yes gene_type:complete
MSGSKDEGYNLYMKVNCSICLGGQREGVFVNCPYCDVDRKTFIEASFKTIKVSLKKNLSVAKQNELVKFLNDGSGNSDNL